MNAPLDGTLDHAGADADRLRITPDNVDVIPGRLRPRSEDF